MGRYIHGTAGFSYKYIYAEQPTNLSALASWSGIAQPETSFSLHTQFFVDHSDAHEDAYELVTGVGHLTSCFAAAVPPFNLVDNVESAIYQVCDRWAEVIRTIERVLPGPALSPDIGGGGSFVLRNADWAALAERIGHGVDPGRPETLTAAKQALLASGEQDYLPFLAACALDHAVGHELERFEMVDTQPRQTNLWDVAQDYAGPYDPAASWDDRAVRVRLMTFQSCWTEAKPLLRELLRERPDALTTARALFAGLIWTDDWAGVHEVADELLRAEQNDSTRGELLRWRGEAAWCIGRLEAARADADAAAELGWPRLREALREGDESQTSDN